MNFLLLCSQCLEELFTFFLLSIIIYLRMNWAHNRPALAKPNSHIREGLCSCFSREKNFIFPVKFWVSPGGPTDQPLLSFKYWRSSTAQLLPPLRISSSVLRGFLTAKSAHLCRPLTRPPHHGLGTMSCCVTSSPTSPAVPKQRTLDLPLRACLLL